MVTRVRLASLETPGAARCRQSSQLGQLLGVRHKDADLGDGVGAFTGTSAVTARSPVCFTSLT
jgi:hypothetical protein